MSALERPPLSGAQAELAVGAEPVPAAAPEEGPAEPGAAPTPEGVGGDLEGEAGAQSRASGRRRGGLARWIVGDLVALVVLGGATAGIVAYTHSTSTTVSSQSGLVEGMLDGITAPVSGTVVEAPALPLGRVRKGEVLFAIQTVTGATVKVTAPESGQLASVTTSVGSAVAQGAVLGSVTPNGRFVVVALVSEDRIRKVRVGDKATIQLTEDPGASFTGHVQSIWPQSAQTYLGSSLLTSAAAAFIKQTQLMPVVVSLPYEPHGIAVGESAEVQIDVGNG